MLKILYIGLKYDYGIPSRGYSFEYLNIYDTMVHMNGVEVSLFPFDEVMREVGRAKMNNKLLHAIDKTKPDLCFFVLFTDEITKSTIKIISERGNLITLNWFGDDHWRFGSFSQYWAGLFHWVITTDESSIASYKKIGCSNVILSQWGFNHHLYVKCNLPEIYDVTFIGQVHSRRRKIINRLRRSGINAECWGNGWENGRLPQEEMIKLYSRSKINLNFTQASPAWNWKPIIKVLLSRRADDSVRVNFPGEMFQNLIVLADKKRLQIKGRNFEIPGSGGFLMTQYADNIEKYFVPEEEIVVFSDCNELIEKIRYFLIHDREREKIRSAGYERAQRDHTFEKRFLDIFKTIDIIN